MKLDEIELDWMKAYNGIQGRSTLPFAEVNWRLDILFVLFCLFLFFTILPI